MKRFGTWLVAILLAVCVVYTPALAQKNGGSRQVTSGGDYAAAYEYFSAGDYASALSIVQPLSDRGDSDAQALLAYMYDYGLGVTQDLYYAFQLYKASAEQGYAYAQNQLGVAYRDGRGTTQDGNEAFRWIKAAADQNWLDAIHNVGYAYELGTGVQTDLAEAMRWYQMAADQGYKWSQNAVGYFYETGNGGTQDYNLAAEWYRKAADQGLAVAQSNLGNLYDYGWGVPQDKSQAIYWWQLAADQGYAQAQHNLGSAYQWGNGVNVDMRVAADFYQKAAAQGLAISQNNLGYLYQTGNGVPQSNSEAVYWYQLAANQDFDYALDNLGYLYYAGIGVPQSFTEAVRLWQRAADLGFANSQKNLGVAYEYGEGVPQDYDRAFYYYQISAEQGNLDAQLNLAQAYAEGMGTEVNPQLASEWYTQLTRSGSQEYVDLGNEGIASLDFSKTPVKVKEPDPVVTKTEPKTETKTETKTEPRVETGTGVTVPTDGCHIDVTGRIRTSESRVALVIGNSDYQHAAPLPNPACDAEAMAQMLDYLGFEVVYGVNLTKSELEGKAREFAQKAANASTTLFFYAGHGLQVNGRNYLVPIDATVADATAINFELVDMENVTQFMTGYDQSSGTEKVAVVLLDACRNNPFQAALKRSLGQTRSTNVSQGLAEISTGGGMIIGFATAPDDVASDGNGNHSPFTLALLEHLPASGVEFQTVMTRVKRKVVELTATQPKPQRPWTNSDLTTEFYIAGN